VLSPSAVGTPAAPAAVPQAHRWPHAPAALQHDNSHLGSPSGSFSFSLKPSEGALPSPSPLLHTPVLARGAVAAQKHFDHGQVLWCNALMICSDTVP
jgi:hypothetical protein